MAVRLGRVNVDAMLRELTAKQFIEWECYARLEPFNELRADQRAASIVRMIFNMAVATKDRKWNLEDFQLKFMEKEASAGGQQTWQQKKSIAYAICMAYGAKAKDL